MCDIEEDTQGGASLDHKPEHNIHRNDARAVGGQRLRLDGACRILGGNPHRQLRRIPVHIPRDRSIGVRIPEHGIRQSRPGQGRLQGRACDHGSRRAHHHDCPLCFSRKDHTSFPRLGLLGVCT